MSQANKTKIHDKKHKTAELKINKLLNKIESLKLNSTYLLQLSLPEKRGKYFAHILEGKSKVFAFTAVFLGFLFSAWWIYNNIVLSNSTCLLEVPSSSQSLFRSPEDCSMCIDVEGVVRVANISSQEFEKFYAYSSTPVIVTDATEGWKAMEEFDFNFFANFYRHGKMGTRINDCSFFPYKSGLSSLEEVFSMDAGRANLSGAPWYVGWSTCHDEESRQLRRYYSRPYFLPPTAESDSVDWIFMGGPGQGAHMHVDSVRHVSWQAQLRGRKRWQLAPPPECLYRCRRLRFTVAPGEILVVDTNRWYHSTQVLPGDISITIGAEYD